jgi:hypothetical protein
LEAAADLRELGRTRRHLQAQALAAGEPRRQRRRNRVGEVLELRRTGDRGRHDDERRRERRCRRRPPALRAPPECRGDRDDSGCAGGDRGRPPRGNRDRRRRRSDADDARLLHRAQILDDLSGRLIPFDGLLAKQLRDDRVESARDRPLDGRRLAMKNGVEQLGR